MGTLVEKVRQKCFFASGFEPTNNERNEKELAEVEAHAKAVTKMVKHVKEMQKATDSMLKEAERAYTTHLPRAYAVELIKHTDPDSVLTAGAAKAVPLDAEDPATPHKQINLHELSDIRATVEEKLRVRVYGPVDKWLADYDLVKVHMKELEELRLHLDQARRQHAACELKKVKQERNKGTMTDVTRTKLDNKGHSFEAAKTRFRDKEAGVHEELAVLIARADLLREAIHATFEIMQQALLRAATAAPPVLRSIMSLDNNGARCSSDSRPASPAKHKLAVVPPAQLPHAPSHKYDSGPETPLPQAPLHKHGSPGTPVPPGTPSEQVHNMYEPSPTPAF